jgi:hypothetical protein
MRLRSRALGVLAAAALGALVYAEQTPAKPPVGNLADVAAVIKDPKATPEQRARLVGRTFSGVVVVNAVRLGLPDQSWAMVIVDASGLLPADQQTGPLAMAFQVAASDPALLELRPRARFKFRATLAELPPGGASFPRQASFATFTDVVIEGPGL